MKLTSIVEDIDSDNKKIRRFESCVNQLLKHNFRLSLLRGETFKAKPFSIYVKLHFSLNQFLVYLLFDNESVEIPEDAADKEIKSICKYFGIKFRYGVCWSGNRESVLERLKNDLGGRQEGYFYIKLDNGKTYGNVEKVVKNNPTMIFN